MSEFTCLEPRRNLIGPQSLGCAFLLSSPSPPFCTPLFFLPLTSPVLFDSIFLFIYLYSIVFESSPEDSVNNLTSQLSLKQCGLGPLLCSVHRGESTAPKGQAGPLALRRTRQVAPHLFTLVWYQKQSKANVIVHFIMTSRDATLTTLLLCQRSHWQGLLPVCTWSSLIEALCYCRALPLRLKPRNASLVTATEGCNWCLSCHDPSEPSVRPSDSWPPAPSCRVAPEEGLLECVTSGAPSRANKYTH